MGVVKSQGHSREERSKMETMRRSETVARTVGKSSGPERVFFIIDRSRLKEESDELKDAVVVYIPKADLDKPSLEQRCSQLIGISLLIFNYTSKLPKFIRLKSHGFAIRPLGDTPCVMGLQSKFDEPKSCVIHYLDRIHDFFMFSYSSLNYVMEMSHNDWEIFTTEMTAIFQSILDFTFRHTHTLPSMFNPLPYVTLDSDRGGSKLFLQVHRLLRNIQLKNSVIGGCLFYNGELLCSQLPPDIAEKLLFVANGGVDLNRRSILDDEQMPESVWIIDIYLTPEELAILHQIQRPHKDIASFYSDLSPDPSLPKTVFKSTSVGGLESDDLPPPPAPPPLPRPPSIYRADSGGSVDFVTISLSTNSVSFSAAHSTNVIAPLKRPKVNRRFSHSYEELANGKEREYEELPSFYSPQANNDLSTLTQRQAPPSYREVTRGGPPPLPPRPGVNSSQAPPPLPTCKGEVLPRPLEEVEAPPPIPPRPGPPPIPNRSSVPVPPLRTTSVYRHEPNPPPLPAKNTSQWIQGNEQTDDVEESPTSPGGVYGTPIAEGLIMEEYTRRDSEGSERFGTPSSNSPVPLVSSDTGEFQTVSLSTVTSDHNTSSYLTPLVTSLTTSHNESTGSNNSTDGGEGGEHKLDIYSTLDRSFDGLQTKESDREEEGEEEEGKKEEKRGVPIDDDTIRKVSQISNASSDLIMTKGISEPGSYDSGTHHLHDYKLGTLTDETSLPENCNNDGDITTESPPPPPFPVVPQDVEIEQKEQLDYESSLDKDSSLRNRENSSPTPYEFTESPSENEDHLGSLRAGGTGVVLRHNPLRPRAESWIGRQSFMGQENEMTQRVISFERKTIYVQKCFNTVAAIVADTNLPNEKELVQGLWKNMLTHLLHINNTVESCILEQEELYMTGEALKSEGPRTYQAVYSGMTGNCEVSSATAPYQFRHAARRAHQEYLLNPSLRQLSLCKEYCRMFCQNTMGRESYIHTGRTIVNDSLGTHVVLERHAKMTARQQKLNRNGIDCNNAPNLSFL